MYCLSLKRHPQDEKWPLCLGYRNDGSYFLSSIPTAACLPVLLVSLVSLSKNAFVCRKTDFWALSWVSQGGPFLVCGCKGTAIFWNHQIFSTLFCKKSAERLTKVKHTRNARARTFYILYARENAGSRNFKQRKVARERRCSKYNLYLCQRFLEKKYNLNTQISYSTIEWKSSWP